MRFAPLHNDLIHARHTTHHETALHSPGDAVTAPPQAGSIGLLLATLRGGVLSRPGADKITVRDLCSGLQEESFIVLMLVFALLLVSPLSAIPFATSLFGLTIASVLIQYLVGKRSVWLPRLLLDRQVPVQQTLTALTWLERPARWLDARLHPRLTWVIQPPVAMSLKVLVCTAALCAPMLELIPGSGTSVGMAITLFGAGLLARDGVFVLVGASLAAILPVTLWIVIG